VRQFLSAVLCLIFLQKRFSLLLPLRFSARFTFFGRRRREVWTDGQGPDGMFLSSVVGRDFTLSL